MNNLPRQALRRILAKHGKDVCGDANRCENLLKDSCGSYRREINVLVAAIEDRVPLDLLAASRSMPLELLLTRLEKRLEEQTAMTREAARWAVESWALALEVATDAEIEERRRKQADSPLIKPETIQSPEPENKSTLPNVSNVNRGNSSPPKTPTQVPPQKTAPPSNRQPTKIPLPAPPVYPPTNNQPPMQAPTVNPQIQPTHPTAVTKIRFGIFRGCLLVVFLLVVASIVLLLGVPYAIEVMRETQRERNTQPTRFPPR